MPLESVLRAVAATKDTVLRADLAALIRRPLATPHPDVDVPLRVDARTALLSTPTGR
jgi:hypothetical protein